MTFEMVSAYYFFGIIGGIYAIYAGGQKMWKKFTGKVDVLYKRGGFHDSAFSGCASVVVGLVNRKDVPVALTDVIGTFKYDKQRWRPDKKNPDQTFSIRPKIEPVFPVNIKPNEAIELKLNFEMFNVQLSSLNRFNTAEFVGFEQGVPIAIVDINENEKNWDKRPVQMTLSIHVNGREILTFDTPIYMGVNKIDDLQGSFSEIKIAEIEHKTGSVEND